ncbi:MAG TPA: CHASE3 domain-containing protein [Caulobacteraceae bacterium]|nr:CHASE3 domain-containing protein [Caulobacteraceae bacterium]
MALLIGFGLLILAGVATLILADQAANAERWVAHTREVQAVNQHLFTKVEDATLAERGFLITRDDRYLRLFLAAAAGAPPLEARLASLTTDNPDARTRVAAVRRAAEAQIVELGRVIGLLRGGRPAEAVAAVRGHLLVNRLETVRAASDAVDAGEARLLVTRQAALALRRALLLAAVVVALAASMAVALVVVAVSRRHVAELDAGRAELAAEMARREATESQLRQSQKMDALGQLTGGIAHDFNNVLAIVIGNLDMLGRRLGDEAAPRRLLERALDGAQRAARLTQSLLAFSRQQPLSPRSLDVNRTVAEMSELLRGALGEHVVIETVLAGGLWPALIDAAQLESAILNLALNARDAMVGGGKLTIETANAYLDDAYAAAEASVTPGQYVLLALTDTGAGMTSDLIARVFDPFVTTKPPGQGTGLGLSQVHGFVKQSGGHVKLYSEVGAGTTVKLYLPRSRVAIEEPAAPLQPQPVRDTAGTTVLVVEDDAGVREFAAGALKELGYRVHQADGGRAALAALENHVEIALLLTDVVMPGLNGRSLAEQALARKPGLKVLFMTGYTRNAIVHNGVLDPDALLVTKPFTLQTLAAKIRQALEG